MDQIRALIGTLQRLSLGFTRSRASLAAGGLAYFVALSVVPAALAFGAVAGVVLEPDQLRSALDRLADRAPDTVGVAKPVLDALIQTVEDASAASFTMTTLVSVVIAVYAASKVVVSLRMAMNTIFDVVETRSGLVERLVSTVVTLVAMIVGVGLVVVVTVLPAVLSWLGVDPPGLLAGSWLANWAVIVVLVYVVARWLIGHAPNRTVRLPWLSAGAGVATVGVVAVTAGVGLYARLSSSLSAAVLIFGTAVVVLVWLYLCFLALLWGALVEADRQRADDGDGGRVTATSTATAEDRPPAR